MAVMVARFLLQVFQRFTKHKCDDTSAGYHEQKVRHGFHLLPVRFRGGMVSSLPLYIGKISDLFIQSQTTSFVNPLSVSIPYFAAIGRLQLVDISKIDLNSKIKKFSHSFICGKGYSPPFGGENSFLSTVWSSLFEGVELAARGAGGRQAERRRSGTAQP